MERSSDLKMKQTGSERVTDRKFSPKGMMSLGEADNHKRGWRLFMGFWRSTTQRLGTDFARSQRPTVNYPL